MDIIGRQILNYRIERLIGEGGMGNVYLAVHTHIGRKVAIKALNPNLARNPEIRERFKNEAAMLSQLHHSNIVALYDYVELDFGVFLVMEFADGQPLDEYIEKVTGPIPEAKAIPLFAQILDGVAYAHQKNVVHRDIKPSNIIVDAEGKAKILDFGIAKIIGESSHKLTKTGTKLGTVLYMSPEQVRGQEIDFRTDIYSLGITLFEMLTGKCPFDSNSSEYEVYKKIVEEPLPEPKMFYPGVSAAMTDVIRKATDKDPFQRFTNCAEFREYVTGQKNIIPAMAATFIPIDAGNRKKQRPPKARRSRSMIFWNIFMPLFLVSAITLTIFKLANLTEDRYVLAWKLYLRKTKSTEGRANAVKIFDFGEKLSVLDIDQQADGNGLKWARVRDGKGKEGFVALNYLGSEKEYEQIKMIFNGESQKETNVAFKKAMREYFARQDYFDSEGNPFYLVNHDPESGYNAYTGGDFNDDGIADYACIIQNTTSNIYRLAVFAGKQDGEAELLHSEEMEAAARLSTLGRGASIYTGKVNIEYQYDIWGNAFELQKKVYETLNFDALVVKYKKSRKRFLYVYEKASGGFTQTLELK